MLNFSRFQRHIWGSFHMNSFLHHGPWFPRIFLRIEALARLVAVVGSAIALKELFLQLQRHGKRAASNLGERRLELQRLECRNRIKSPHGSCDFWDFRGQRRSTIVLDVFLAFFSPHVPISDFPWYPLISTILTHFTNAQCNHASTNLCHVGLHEVFWKCSIDGHERHWRRTKTKKKRRLLWHGDSWRPWSAYNFNGWMGDGFCWQVHTSPREQVVGIKGVLCD